MKTKKFLGCLAALTMTLHASAQVAWDTNGNTVNLTTEWFGADASSTAPLQIETRANDRDIVLQTIGGSAPTAVRTAQLP